MTSSKLRSDRSVNADASTARITHGDRLVYPQDDLRKVDVANYYAAIAPWWLREGERRPLSVVRYPIDIGHEGFFQKHVGRELGEHVHQIRLLERSGKRAAYFYIDTPTALTELAQQNVIELHTWGTHVDDTTHCDRLVFDLDPGADVSWKEIAAGARRLRAGLRSLGLQAFLRTTGGNGLHVVVPIRPAASWRAAHAFAQTVARSMAEQAPDRFVYIAGKHHRQGLIFVDYLRNTRGATSISNYSLRARPHAPVATPIRWNELSRVNRGDFFHLRNIPTRLARLKQDPWLGIDELGQSLPSPSRIKTIRF